MQTDSSAQVAISSSLKMDRHDLAIATASLGWHEKHTLPEKLRAAARHGFKGVEVVFGDLEKEAARLSLSLDECAFQVRKQLDYLRLKAVSIAPFENYEGSPLPLALRLRSALQFIQMARIIGAPILQIPASYYHASLAACDDTIIEELRNLADAALPKPGTNEATITVAYEPMSWSVRCSTWQQALEVKHRVARPNFKLCLDTYHILTKLWGDCTSPDGRIPGGDEALKASLYETLRLMHPDDVGFVQLSDAGEMKTVSHEELRRRRKHQAEHWSGVGRIFPLDIELGAYLPMLEIVKTWLVDMGWRGWVSMEIFHRTMEDEARGPEYWASKGATSWRRLTEALESTPTSGIRSKI